MFSQLLLAWFFEHGRHDLPWQDPKTPYRVWISEVMLQQTQVRTVIPYFLRFMTAFPTIEALACAHEDEVLALWAGLGYYSRARNMHATAQKVMSHFNGQLPDNVDDLSTLPGIGQSTAAAITSLAFEKPAAILDGNVVRVLSRCFLVDGVATLPAVKARLWSLANECLPADSAAEYTQAIMDLGATCCTRVKPNCVSCPLQTICRAYLTSQVDAYPAKKPKKQVPKRQANCFIFYRDNRIYLEKRSSPGIWGGLWCLPLSSEDNRLNTITVEHVVSNPLLAIKHVFTHFQLTMQVYLMPATELRNHTGNWVNQDEIKTLGLPKPIGTILDFFWKSNLSNNTDNSLLTY